MCTVCGVLNFRSSAAENSLNVCMSHNLAHILVSENRLQFFLLTRTGHPPLIFSVRYGLLLLDNDVSLGALTFCIFLHQQHEFPQMVTLKINLLGVLL